ncbi:MAG TPA: host attachment protein [Burkholderiales bacterium]|nr:host attachment protein [Burkholderiales bacterium]
MPTTWIVTGDAARARILQVTGRNQVEEIESFVNPKGRMHDRDLENGARPRFDGHGGVGKPGSASTGGPGNDREDMGASELEAEKFSRQIGRYLDHARVKKRYDRLFIVAPPRFLGMMRKELGKEVQKLVQDEIDKDLSWFDAREIDRFLKGDGTAARYP